MEKRSQRKVGVAQCDQIRLEGKDAILDREALQGGFGDPVEPSSRAVIILVFQESR